VEENPAADAGCTPVVDLVVADSDGVVVGVDIDYYGTNLAVVAIVLPHHYYVYHVEKRVGGSCYSIVAVVGAVDRLPSSYYLERHHPRTSTA